MDNTEYFGLYVTATPPAATLTGTELVPVIVSGITNNTTTQAIANLALSAATFVTNIGGAAGSISITTGTGGPAAIDSPAIGPNLHMCTLIVTVQVSATDATVFVTPSIDFTDQTGNRTITFATFKMDSVQTFSYEVNYQATGAGTPSASFTWITAAGTGSLFVAIRLLDNGN